MTQLLSLEAINKLTKVFEKKMQLLKKQDDFESATSKCYACRGIGTIFLSDYTYGSSCWNCVCNSCEEFYDDCECKN